LETDEPGSRIEDVEQRIAEGRIAARAGSFEWDLKPGIVRWSDELCRIYGLKPGEFEGTVDAYIAHVYPDDRDRTRKLVAEVFQHPHGIAYEHRVVRSDGAVRILYSRVDLIADRAGRPLHMIGSCWDVTDRRLPDSSPASAVGLLRAVLEASVDGILVVDRIGEVVTFNDRFLVLWGIPHVVAAERSERALIEFVQPRLEDPTKLLERVHSLYVDFEADSFDIVRFKDGRVLELHSKPHRIGAAIVGRVWTFRDVTLRENLLARQTLLSDASRVLSSLELDSALAALARVVVPCLGEACEIELAFADGPRRIASGTFREGASVLRVPLYEEDVEGGTSRVIGTMSFSAEPGRTYGREELELAEELAHRVGLELENQRLVGALEQALRTRDDFLSIAAHEIRGPLMSIRLAVDSLRLTELPHPKREQLHALLAREDRRLARFVDELLDLSRIRTGRLDVHVEEGVDLPEIVRHVVERLHTEIAHTGSAVSLVVPDQPVRGRWDRFRIDQVVTNLLTNAVKFGLGKPIEITIRTGEGKAILEVADHGIGVAPELRERIFEPFERGVSVRHYGGLGLGLFIVRVILARLGGIVHCEPTNGAGARFIVELPLPRSV
jgi:PAS domain S-box-containing protein